MIALQAFEDRFYSDPRSFFSELCSAYKQVQYSRLGVTDTLEDRNYHLLYFRCSTSIDKTHYTAVY